MGTALTLKIRTSYSPDCASNLTKGPHCPLGELFRTLYCRRVRGDGSESTTPPVYGLRKGSISNVHGAPLQTREPVLESEGVRRQITQFFEATADGIVFLDRNYRITFVNPRAAALLEPMGELLGGTLFERFPTFAYDGAVCVENYRRTMDLAEPADFEHFYPEPLKMWLRIQSFPALDGIMVFFRDVTEERLSREALRRKSDEAERQHAELETIYRTAPIGLALFDLDDYHYLRLNDRQAAFFGLKPEQIVGKTLIEMAPIEGLRELFDQVARGEPVVNYPLEGALATDPSEYRYWTVSYFPVYSHDGGIQAITAASLEITPQKKAEQALIQSEKTCCRRTSRQLHRARDQ